METELRAVYATLGELMGCIGIMDALVDQVAVESLSEGWSERLSLIREWAENQTGELVEFGSAHDGGEESDDAGRV